MDVKDIINLMAQTSIGIDNPTETTRKIYLNYLNLYHFELYNKIAKINPFIAQDRTHWVEITNNVVVDSDDVALKANGIVQINKIYWTKTNGNENAIDSCELLTHKLQDNLIVIDKPIGFFTEETKYVYIDSIPSPKYFTETTTADEIPYPLSYQQVLIYGANYHMYQNEGGMKSTQQMQFNMLKCRQFEENLLLYLYNLPSKKESIQEYRGM